MATFEGIVTVEDDRVPVTVGIDPTRVTLVAGDVSIGEWPVDECVITDEGGGTWSIEAEDEKLSFQPEEPGRFAASLDGNDMPTRMAAPEPEAPEPEMTEPGDLEDVESSSDGLVVDEGPPPRSATLIGFYALAALTAALGVWALISLIA